MRYHQKTAIARCAKSDIPVFIRRVVWIPNGDTESIAKDSRRFTDETLEVTEKIILQLFTDFHLFTPDPNFYFSDRL
jgi:hypothetical protein